MKPEVQTKIARSGLPGTTNTGASSEFVVVRNLVAPGQPDGPGHLPWKDYEALVLSAYSELLKSSPGDERAFQRFLEQHPSMFPSEARRHGTWPLAVISQPILDGYDRKVPDFMLIEENSGAFTAVMVEIETPGKRWATKDGGQHSDLTKALDQIADWKGWLDQPGHKEQLRDFYHFPNHQGIDVRYMLVYGRRREAMGHERTQDRRRFSFPAHVEAMTFDRLAPDHNHRNTVTLKRVRTKRRDEPKYRLVGIPACFVFPWAFHGLCGSATLDESIVREAPFMPSGRPDVIIRHWPIVAEQERRDEDAVDQRGIARKHGLLDHGYL